MSSHENRASAGEVILSPEAQLEADYSPPPKWDGAPNPGLETQTHDSATAIPGQNPEATEQPSSESQGVTNSEPQGMTAEAETPSSAEPAKAPVEAQTDSSEEADAGEIKNLMESVETAPALAQGEIVRGNVLKLTDEEVFVDLGLKSEAVIPRSEFLSEDGHLTVAAGDSVNVLVEKFDDLTGIVVVSYRKALQEKLWEDVERAFHEEKLIRGRIVERVKGGLVIDVGVQAFLPGSQADLKPHPNLEEMIGQEIECRVIKLNRKRGNVVVSRRKVLEEENDRKKRSLLEKLAEGTVLTGHVKNLADYGAFVDLGGIDGLLHLSDLSWGRVAHPSEVIQVGQEIQVKVLKFDTEKERVSLGLKQLTPDPWEQVASRFHAGDRIRGSVVSVTDYGAFVELEPGIEGLIHISEMSWSNRLRHPSKILKPGDPVDVAVLDVSSAQRRISLSLKQTLPNPWTDLCERLGEGTVVKGRVRHFTDFGAFVEVEDGVEGLIHVSNFSWTKTVKHPSEMLQKGQEIEAVVLNVDPDKRRLSLGLKQLQPDAWENFFNKTSVGNIVHAKVTRRTSFGVFAEIEEGIEGLCHISEIEDHYSRGEQTLPKVGSELDFRIIRLNPEEKKIGLSMKTDASQPAQMRTKQPETASLSRMAEAFSSAGITTSAMLQASEEREKSHQK